MGNSLNNAFVRAYAKDRQSHQPNEASAATAAHVFTKPAAGSSLATAVQTDAAPKSIATIPITYNQPPARTAASQPAIRSAQSTVQQNPGVFRTTFSAGQYEDVDSVLRRIDLAAATPIAAPHASPRPSNQVASMVGANSNNVARRLQAEGPRLAENQRTSSRPVLVEGVQEQSQSPAALSTHAPGEPEARRKSIMDYLYAAGQTATKALPAQTSRAELPSAHGSTVDLQGLVSSSIVDAWSGSSSQASSSSSIPLTRPIASRVDEPAEVPSSSTRGSPKPTSSSFVESFAQKPPSRMTAGHAPALLPNYGVAQQSTTQAAPSSVPSQATIQQADLSSKQGEILRLDVPPASTIKVNSTAKNAASSIPAGKPSQVDSRSLHAPERANVEHNLRLAKTRVFNPVWEVDELQWPIVCSQLLQERAANLAEVVKNLKAACQDGLQVLGITSAHSGEGTTTVASCLALLCAQHGLKVVLIDGNVAAPSLCSQTNLEIENDWRTSIAQQMPLEEVAVHSITDQLTLIPLHSETGSQQILASDQRIANMIRELSDSFDLVIVDVGPINSPSALITNLARENVFDAAMVVVDQRRSEQQTVDNCIIRIQHTGISSIGIVENFAA